MVDGWSYIDEIEDVVPEVAKAEAAVLILKMESRCAVTVWRK